MNRLVALSYISIEMMHVRKGESGKSALKSYGKSGSSNKGDVLILDGTWNMVLMPPLIA